MFANQIILQKRTLLSWWHLALFAACVCVCLCVLHQLDVRPWRRPGQLPALGFGREQVVSSTVHCHAEAFREELERRLSKTSKSEDLKQVLVEAPVTEVSTEAPAEAPTEVTAEAPNVSVSTALSLNFSARETEVEALAPRSLLSPIAGSGSSSSSSPRTFVSQGSRSLARERCSASSFAFLQLPAREDEPRRENSGRGARGQHRPLWGGPGKGLWPNHRS